MAKAPSKYPVTLVRGDQEREVHQVASFNQAIWDGFDYKDGEAPAGEGEKELTPQQKAAATRKANAAAKAAEKQSSESSVGTSAVSGGTADGETTVGSNPS